jgi:cellulose synthase/poly-beta-1,6-N-acetylglucosamine synthase-like glycosyltransferase
MGDSRSALITLLTLIYTFFAIILGVYTGSQLILLLLYLRHRNESHTTPKIAWEDLPGVAVQLPIYNEKYVVDQLLQAVSKLKYPRSQLIVQVLDDSTDDTSDLVATRVAWLQDQGLNIQHIQREQRQGFKAGAMAYGMKLLARSVEYIAVLDADFVPPPDFLLRTVPHFVGNPTLGIVQTRWGHTNADTNWLTRAQSLAIDAHFVVEQVARNRSGLLLTFNGTGGVWRRECIEDAGGWSARTLTEDLDLSYRAQIKGWKYLYLPDIVVPGEIPPVMVAYKKQQARWAQGTNQCLAKLIGPVMRSNLSFIQKLMAAQHLVQYLPHTVMLTLLIMTPPLILADSVSDLPLAPLGILGILPPLMHLLTQHRIHRGMWIQRMLYFPVLMVIGTGIMVNNAHAAFKAFSSVLRNEESEFIRTPKYGGRQKNSYRLQRDWTVIAEMFLGFYSFGGLLLALMFEPALAPYMGLYTLAYTAMILWNFYDQWRLKRAVETAEPAEIIEWELAPDWQVEWSEEDTALSHSR